MEKKKYKKITKQNLIVISLIILSMIFVVACSKENDSEKYVSLESAIKNYISDNKKISIEDIDLTDYIIGEMSSGNTVYYVIHDNKKYDDTLTEIVFMLAVHKESNGYSIEKASQDVSLNNDIDDPAPNVSYTLDVDEDNVHFAVGKIYDSSYTAYLDENKIDIDDNGIYCTSSSISLDVRVTD